MASPLLLTNAMKGDIIMAWDESEHPRDSDGKFTDGNGTSAKSGSIIVGKGEKVDNLPDDLPSTRKTVNPGEYSKDSEAYGNRIKTELGIPNVEISRIDPNCAQDVYDGIRSVLNAFPKIKGFVQSLRYDPDLHEFGQWSWERKEIRLGRSYANKETVKKMYEYAIKHKKFPSNTTHKGIIVHEMAHAIDAKITGSSSRFSEKLVMQICQEYGLTKKIIRKYFGSYSGNSEEFFAFCIQDYIENKEHSTLSAKNITRIVKEKLSNDT